MIIVIDAYNVLKQIKQKEISSFERKAFINTLTKYAQQKGHTVVIVFDGGDAVWPMIEKNPPTTIVYSGFKLTADDYIRRYLKEHHNKELLLVTSDRELKSNADRYEVETIDSMAFYAYMKPKPQEKPKKRANDVIKTTQTTMPELDDLMFGVDHVPEKHDEHRLIRRSSGFTPSKKERKINKKIKKL